MCNPQHNVLFIPISLRVNFPIDTSSPFRVTLIMNDFLCHWDYFVFVIKVQNAYVFGANIPIALDLLDSVINAIMLNVRGLTEAFGPSQSLILSYTQGI